MTTRTIGIKEFRQNLTRLCEKAQKESICFIVMNHLRPVIRVEPIDDEESLIDQLILEKYGDQIERGIKEFREGKSLTAAQVRKNLGIE